MRQNDVTIPSEFVKMDTNVTAADSCVNVHDQTTFRRNHNIALAQRVRKDLVSQVCSGFGESTPEISFWLFRPRFSADGETRSRILSIPLYVTQQNQSFTFWCTACKSLMNGSSTLAEDPKIYVVVHEPQVAFMGGLTDNAITVSAAYGTPTGYSVTVGMPALSGEYTLHYGRIPIVMDVYLRTYIDDTHALVSGGTIVDAGSDWVDGTFAGVSARDVVFLDGASYAEPRQIVDRKTIGSDTRHWLDAPWTSRPSTASTVTIRQVLGINLFSYGVYEDAITDFGDL